MEERMEQIIKESGRIFQTYGLRNVSMDDIAREMGISKKTLYQYVENKADLVRKILEYHSRQEEHFVSDFVSQGMNAIDILLTVSQMVCQTMKGFKPAAMYELQKYYPEIYKSFFENKKQSIAERMKKNLDRGISEGLYRDSLDTELTAQMYVQNMQELHGLAALHAGEITYEKAFHTLFDNHIRAIVNAAGLAYYERKTAEGEQA